MATRSSMLAWEIPGQRSLAGYRPWSCKELDITEHTHTHTHTHTHAELILRQAQFQGLDMNGLIE